MVGTTSNGLLTYVNSETASVESGMTFDGSVLEVYGNQNLYGNLDVTGNPVFGSEDTRPSYYFGGSGLFQIKGQTGAWQSLYGFRGSSNTDLGGFGASGTTNTLSYYYIGDSYNDTTMVIQPNGENVGIGTTNPLSKLHVSTGNNVDSGNVDFIIGGTVGDNARTGRIVKNTSSPYEMTIRSSNSATSTQHLILNDTGGNVGIGTTNPSGKLQVTDVNPDVYITSADTGQSDLYFGGATAPTKGNIKYSDNADAFMFNVNTSTEAMRIISSGNVGIGTTTPDGLLHVSAGTSGDAVLIIQADTDNNDENDVPQIWFKADGDITEGLIGLNNNYLDFISNVTSAIPAYGFRFLTGTTNNTGTTDPYNGATEKMCITGPGKVGIGITAPTFQLQLSTNSAAKPSSNVWTITSDSRVKENIRDYTTGLEAILEIEPKLYDYNGKAGFEKTKNNIGIIAQDIQEVMPETIISYNAKLNEDDTEDTELLSFDGHAVTFALINAVKELKAEIEQLKTQINN